MSEKIQAGQALRINGDVIEVVREPGTGEPLVDEPRDFVPHVHKSYRSPGAHRIKERRFSVTFDDLDPTTINEIVSAAKASTGERYSPGRIQEEAPMRQTGPSGALGADFPGKVKIYSDGTGAGQMKVFVLGRDFKEHEIACLGPIEIHAQGDGSERPVEAKISVYGVALGRGA